MKNKGFLYFVLQVKRKAKMLPRVLALTLALLLTLGAAGYVIYKNSVNDTMANVITMGIAGEKDDRLIDVCVGAINSFDSLRFAVRAVKLTEEEARENLIAGMISGYIVVPENYARDLYYGKDTSLKYVSISGASGLGMTLITEIIDNTAKAGLETTNAIYGAQYYVRDHFPGKNVSDAGDRLFERIAALMLTRQDTYRTKTLGVSGHSSLITYMICGLMIVYLLFWGVSCSPLFRAGGELSCMLSARGFGATRQIAGEAGSYIVLMALCTLPVFLIAKAAVFFAHIDIGDFAALLSGKAIALYFLCAVMLCLMQLFLYELARDAISAPLLQFLNAVVQGYICGCFYPQAFFPESVSAFASHLPVGVAVRLSGDASTGAVVETVLYGALFFTATVILRLRVIRRREAQS